MKFTGKNKACNKYHVSQIIWLDWSKTAKQFSVSSLIKFLCQYQWNFSGISCTFCFGQMFNGFLQGRLIFNEVWP